MLWPVHCGKGKFFMSDIKQARAIFDMACKDLNALRGMTDGAVFDDEIFGFHTQQAIEKALKAWIAILGLEYPLTHDISFLLNFLEEREADIGRYWDLVIYNAFAVRFRYEAMAPVEEPLDRPKVIKQVKGLLDRVEKLFKDFENPKQ